MGTKKRAKIKLEWDSSEAILVPAGEYFVGDPCYAIRGDDTWSAVCACLRAAATNNPVSIVLPTGHIAVMTNTLYGDGTYKDNGGLTYPVDAGLIGVVPLKALTSEELEYATHFGHFFSFAKMVSFKKTGGLIKIGKVEINTGD